MPLRQADKLSEPSGNLAVSNDAHPFIGECLLERIRGRASEDTRGHSRVLPNKGDIGTCEHATPRKNGTATEDEVPAHAIILGADLDGTASAEDLRLEERFF